MPIPVHGQHCADAELGSAAKEHVASTMTMIAGHSFFIRLSSLFDPLRSGFKFVSASQQYHVQFESPSG
jgi:hypothetical protein